MTKIAYIEDHVVPQLFTTAIEAYEFTHQSTANAKGYTKLETFGLLWGYSIPAKGEGPARVIATMATTETSAVRHTDWVKPNFNSIKAKKEFFERYWPNIELVGTFHSHPYDSIAEINKIKGWQASPGDEKFWPHFHKEIAPDQPTLCHLIVSITKLQKRGWAFPDRLANSESNKGYVLSADYRKLWLRVYSSNMVMTRDENQCIYSDDMTLEIPALQKRFQ
ncbi:hypothetical protein [Metapseudomonas boanensis]|uniref:hypothetical protein n=1 Tax=Metapseudomonas boanensis TaxID=2822138 RepID=UPI00203FA855|nr:hypothetical protein [Pseudomonas boanensis]